MQMRMIGLETARPRRGRGVDPHLYRCPHARWRRLPRSRGAPILLQYGLAGDRVYMSTQQINTPLAPAAGEETGSLLVSVVIPCLNEAENIERCVLSARKALAGIDGE